jgi:hypothetical protein
MTLCTLYVATDKLPEYQDRLDDLKECGLILKLHPTNDTTTRITVIRPVWYYA